jgi:hypothetical protein
MNGKFGVPRFSRSVGVVHRAHGRRCSPEEGTDEANRARVPQGPGEHRRPRPRYQLRILATTLTESGHQARLAARVRLSRPRHLPAKKKKEEALMRLGSVILVIWLIIGVIACVQRNYFNDKVSCATAGTVVVTILAGPLNYVGINPKLSCH